MSKESDFIDRINQQLGFNSSQLDQFLQQANAGNIYAQSVAKFELTGDGDAIEPYKILNQQIAEFTPQLLQQINALSGFSRKDLPPAFQEVLTNLDALSAEYGKLAAAGGRTDETGAALTQLTRILGGQTPEQTVRFDAANKVLADQGFTQGLRDLQKLAGGLTVNGGFDAGLSSLLSSGQGILAAGGRTDEINRLSSTGQSLISSGGMTPELSQLMSQLQNGLSTRGMTPEMQQLFGEVSKIIQSGGKGGALLPMETVVSMARDAAATAANQQAEGVRREAIQRGGASVFAGTTGQALAEFSDERLRAEGAATREAALGQQGLQLQQLLGALQAGTNLTNQANQVTTALLSMGVDVARVASQNIATGGSLMANAEQLANQRLQLGGQFVSQAEQQALQRITAGMGSLADIEQLAGGFRQDAMTQLAQLTNEQLSAGQGIGNITQLETQRLLAGLGGQGAITGAQLDLLTDQQQTALKTIAMQGDVFFQGVGTQADNLNSMNMNILNYIKSIADTSQPYFQLAQGAQGGINEALGTQAQAYGQKFLQPGFLQSLGTSFAQGFGSSLGQSLTGGIGAGLGGGFDTGGKK